MNKKRYCRECGELTRPATLLDWLLKRKPSCSQCHNQYDIPEYCDCPGCGWPLDDEGSSLVSCTRPTVNYEGVQDWKEYHECPECGEEWYFYNGT